MLFGEQDMAGPFIGAGGTAILMMVGGGIAWWYTRKDKRDDKKRDDLKTDSEDLIKRWQVLLERANNDCDEKLEAQDRKIVALEAKVDRLIEALTRQKELAAMDRGRILYLEGHLRAHKIPVDSWETVTPPTVPPGTDTHKSL